MDWDELPEAFGGFPVAFDFPLAFEELLAAVDELPEAFDELPLDKEPPDLFPPIVPLNDDRCRPLLASESASSASLARAEDPVAPRLLLMESTIFATSCETCGDELK
jgi:hypothetical protein